MHCINPTISGLHRFKLPANSDRDVSFTAAGDKFADTVAKNILKSWGVNVPPSQKPEDSFEKERSTFQSANLPVIKGPTDIGQVVKSDALVVPQKSEMADKAESPSGKENGGFADGKISIDKLSETLTTFVQSTLKTFKYHGEDGNTDTATQSKIVAVGMALLLLAGGGIGLKAIFGGGENLEEKSPQELVQHFMEHPKKPSSSAREEFLDGSGYFMINDMEDAYKCREQNGRFYTAPSNSGLFGYCDTRPAAESTPVAPVEPQESLPPDQEQASL